MTKLSLPQPVTIKKIIKENFRTKTFITNTNIKAQPGQFIMIWLPRLAEKPFSLLNSNPLSFTVVAVGPFSKILNSKVKVGNKIWFRGPFGKGFSKETPGKKILVAGGYGCVPLYFLANKIKSKKSTRAILGVKTKKELLFVNKFKKLKLKTIITTDNGSAGTKGFTTDILQQIISKEKISCVYSCGPYPMLKKIAKLCHEYKINYQLSLEALMKCGFGVCGACSIKGKLICQDGPVLKKWPE